jgi:hypothetical protein
MRFAFSHMGMRYELSGERSPGDAPGPGRAGWEGHAALRGLLEQEPGLHGLRSYLALHLHWLGLDGRSPAELLSEVSRALSQGRLRLLSTPRRTGRAGRARPAEPEPETEWIEQAPSAPEASGDPAYAVDPAAAALLAAENRDMAGEGTPLKEICPRPDCPVCHAQLALIGA